MESQRREPIGMPLQFQWTLWFDARDGKPRNNRKSAKEAGTTSWASGLRQLWTTATVNEFWTLWNTLKRPSALEVGNTLSLFKRGIEPTWESPLNKGGGRWTLVVSRNEALSLVGGRSGALATKEAVLVDAFWLDTLLAVVGEQLSEGSTTLCGCTCNVRDGFDRLSLWTRGGASIEAITAVGRSWLVALGVLCNPETCLTITFQHHGVIAPLITLSSK